MTDRGKRRVNRTGHKRPLGGRGEQQQRTDLGSGYREMHTPSFIGKVTGHTLRSPILA